MLRAITWRVWATVAVLLGADAAAGYWLATNTHAETLIFKWGLLAAVVIPLVFAVVYTAIGMRGETKWWTNDLGAGLVAASLTLIPIVGPFCWAIWLDNGKVVAPWLIWTELSGPFLSALAWAALCWVFLRYHRDGHADTPPDAP